MNHQRLKRFAQSKEFCHAVNYAIIAFACIVGFETVLKSPDWQFAFKIVDYFFLAFFTLEIILRILAEDHPILYFKLFERKQIVRDGRKRIVIEFTQHGFWNYFDFFLISFSIIGFFAQIFIYPGLIQIARLFRIFRIIRLLEISEHLKEVERRIVSIIPTVFSFAVLLLILTYIYAVLGMFMFGSRTFETCDFSNMLDSFVTLFQVMTLDNWSDVMDDIKAHTDFSPVLIQLYFVSFVVFTSIIAFNVFIAVMTSQVQNKIESELEQKVDEAQQSGETGREQIREGIAEIAAELKLVRAELSELRRRSG